MPIYLDHNASSPLRAEVFEAMRPWLSGEAAANPSSAHQPGQRARLAVERAREEVAALLGCDPLEVVFTSGGTEANNLALLGHGEGRAGEVRCGAARVVTSAIEHPSVAECCGDLDASVRPGADGVVGADEVQAALRDGTRIVSVMLANNETGAIQPVGEIAQRVRARAGERILVHTDAVQAAGRIPVSTLLLGADLVSVSAHKMAGPQGVGALIVRRGTPLAPRLLGGPQERRRRAGTEPVALIVGFGEAVHLARAEMGRWEAVCGPLRDRFEARVRALDPDVRIHAAPNRLPNTSSVAFPGRSAEAIVMALDLAGIAVSTGSACSSGATHPSRVLAAHGYPDDEIRGTIRVSFGPGNTPADLEALLNGLELALARAPEVGAAGRPGSAVRMTL